MCESCTVQQPCYTASYPTCGVLTRVWTVLDRLEGNTRRNYLLDLPRVTFCHTTSEGYFVSGILARPTNIFLAAGLSASRETFQEGEMILIGIVRMIDRPHLLHRRPEHVEENGREDEAVFGWHVFLPTLRSAIIIRGDTIHQLVVITNLACVSATVTPTKYYYSRRISS